MNGKPEPSGHPAQLSIHISASIRSKYIICIMVLLLRRWVNLLSAKCY